MKTLIILMLLLSLGGCKKSEDSASKNPNVPPGPSDPSPPGPSDPSPPGPSDPSPPDPSDPSPSDPSDPTPPPGPLPPGPLPPPIPSTPPPTISEITSVQRVHNNESQVEFVVTFSHAVQVSEGHSPFLSLTVGDQLRQADFERGENGGENGREGVSLFFIYDVEEGDNDDDGITLASSEINLHGGSIKNDSGQDLDNTIPPEYQNFPGVQVEAVLPTISGIAPASGVSSVVSKDTDVDLVVTFDEPVQVTGNPHLVLDVGGHSARATYEDVGSSNAFSLTHTFRYTVGEGQSGSIQVTGLILDDSNFISDEAENKMEGNLSPVSINGVTVDGLVPHILTAARKEEGVSYIWESFVDLIITFSRPVKATGSPSLTLSVGGTSVSASHEGSSTSYSSTQTFRYTLSGQSGSIEVTGVTLDASNFIRDEVGNKAAAVNPSSVSVGGVIVEASDPCATTVTSVFQRGDGSAEAPYLICTYTQLDGIRDDLSAHYELGQGY